jgi:hypothetical protein
MIRLVSTLACGVLGALVAPILVFVIAAPFGPDEIGLPLFTPIFWVVGYLSGVAAAGAIWQNLRRSSHATSVH